MYPHVSEQTAARLRTGSSPVSVSVAASLALMGDSLLYAVLASQAPSLGIPLVSVGLLLSINRFVRLVTNAVAGAVYARFGREWPFFIAMVVAACTTFAYGLPLGLAFFLIARLAWGTCWSFLNLGMYLSVLDHADDRTRGRWMGRVKSISRVGTIISVTLGAYLTDRVGFRPVVFGLAVLALAGAAVSLRDVRDAVSTRNGRKVSSKRSTPAARPPDGAETTPSGWTAGRERAAADDPGAPAALADPDASIAVHASSNQQVPACLAASDTPSGQTAPTHPARTAVLYVLGFVYGFIMHGVVVGTLALFILQRFAQSMTLFGAVVGSATLSGALLGVRWVAEIGWGPLAGAVGDRSGADRTLLAAAAAMAAGLAGLALSQDPITLVALATDVFFAGVLLSVSLDSLVGRLALEENRVNQTMSRYVTAQDLGGALGPLVGYLVGVGMGLEGLYIASGLPLLLVAALASALRKRLT